MEQLLQHIASDVFQGAAQDHAQPKYSNRTICVPGQQGGNQDGAKAVNRANGSKQKAAIDKAMKLNQLADYFHEPPKKGS